VLAGHVSKFDFGEIAKFFTCNSKTVARMGKWFFPLELSDQGAHSQQKKSGKAQPGQKLRAFEIQKNEPAALS